MLRQLTNANSTWCRTVMSAQRASMSSSSFRMQTIPEPPKTQADKPSSVVDSQRTRNETPIQMVTLNKFEKYLVYKLGTAKYASPQEVPKEISAVKLHYAKDKARAYSIVFSILMTAVVSVFLVLIAKRDRKMHKMTYVDELAHKHAAYSKDIQRMIDNSER